MPEDVPGGCFCGAVRFRITLPTEFCGHCHCESCRRSHGAAFVTWTSVPDERFAFTGGEAAVRWHESRREVRWGFCGTCGSSMLYRAGEAPGRTYVTVASLEGPIDREPEAHVSFERRLPFVEAVATIPCFRAKTEERIEPDWRTAD